MDDNDKTDRIGCDFDLAKGPLRRRFEECPNGGARA